VTLLTLYCSKWQPVTTSPAGIEETSGITPTAAKIVCPMQPVAGTNLLFRRARVVSTGTVHELRVNVKVQDANGFAGVVFGFLSHDDYYRVVLRAKDNCVAIHHVVNGTASVLAFGNATGMIPANYIDLTTVLNLRVRWGNGT
jgi:hypothetical protein